MLGCSKCGKIKEDSEYGRDPRVKSGREACCKECRVLRNRVVREKRISSGTHASPVAKACSVCLEVKEPTEYFKDKANFDGLGHMCKKCKTLKTYEWREKNKEHYNKTQRDYQKKAYTPEQRYGHEIKRRYGCSLERYNEMLVAQEGSCAICKELHNPAIKQGRLYVDHCHATGEIRQLLCGSCNSMLGYAKDDTRVMLEAVAYVIKHRKAA